MTTDQPLPPVEDARAEAERRWPTYPGAKPEWPEVRAFVAGAEWAASRAVLSDQEGACVRLDPHSDEDCFPPPAVPSDHTVTTEDAIRVVAVEDVIRPIRSALLDTWGTSIKTGRRTMAADKADGIIRFVIRELGLAGLLATARPDTTEAQAQALEAAADAYSGDTSIVRYSDQERWLRERAAAIRKGADQ